MNLTQFGIILYWLLSIKGDTCPENEKAGYNLMRLIIIPLSIILDVASRIILHLLTE